MIFENYWPRSSAWHKLRVVFGARVFRVLWIDKQAEHHLTNRVSIYKAIRVAREIGGDIFFSPTTA